MTMLTQRITRSLASGALLLAIVILTVGLAYSNIINGELQFDDDVFVNNSLASFKLPPLFSCLTEIITGNRFLTQFTFALNYRFSGLSVTSFHITNIILHVFVVILVVFFVTELLRLAVPDDRLSLGRTTFAILVGAFFALHPLQTESVSYIVQRSEVLASLFYLSCLITLLKFSDNRGSISMMLWLLSLVLFCAGWGCKEIIITAPLSYLLCMLCIGDKGRTDRAIKGILPYVITGVALVLLKLSILDNNNEAGLASFKPGIFAYFLTQLKVLALYLQLFFIPIGQNIDHDISIITSIFSFQAMAYACLWLLLTASSLFLLLRYTGRYQAHLRLIGFGMTWYLALLLPTSSLIPIRDVMAEHRTYLALLGPTIIVFTILDLIVGLKTGLSRVAVCSISAILLIGLGYASHERNKVWRTKLTLWQDAAQKSPGKSRPYNNLANSYLLIGDNLTAEANYRIAIQLDPANIEPYYNLALALKNQGRLDEALQVHRIFVNLVREKSTAQK